MPAAAAAGCPAAPLAAAAAQPASYSCDVRFANYSSVRRREWALATVPFPEGAWPAGVSYRPQGLIGDLTPFGARWPDGSVRYAQLAVRLDLNAGQERIVHVIQGAPATAAFRLSPWTSAGLASFDWQLVVGTASGQRSVRLRPRGLVHDGVGRKAMYFMDRVPGTDLVYDFWLTLYHDQDNAPFELRLTCGNTASTAWQQDIEYVVLSIAGATPFVRGAISRGVRQASVAGRTFVQLMGNTHLCDGQGQEWWGELLFFDGSRPQPDGTLRQATLTAVTEHPFFGCATNWGPSKALGPFGHLPEHPPWVTDVRHTSWLERWKFESYYFRPSGDVWEDMPKGLFPNANNTGEQDDFGIVKMLHVFHTGLPLGIEEARHMGGEDAHRPEHFREADGRPVLARDHPNWISWGGRPHFDRTVSPDRLGKPHPEPWLRSHGWGSRDNQHWSSLTLAAGYLLSGSYSLRAEIDNQIELYLSGHTLPSQYPGWPTNGMGAPRAVGRTHLTMSWLYLITGRQELRTRLAERVRQCVAQQWLGRGSTQLRPIGLFGPDSRVIPNNQFWSPWEDGMAIIGLEANYRVTGQPEARWIAAWAAKTLLTYGWKIEPNDCIVGTGIAWNANGRPLTAQQYRDPQLVVWAYGTGYNSWTLGASKLALGWAIQAGDTDLASRAWAAIQHTNANRQVPFNQRWDHFYEWDAAW